MAFKPILDEPAAEARWRGVVSRVLFGVFGLAALAGAGFFVQVMLASGLSVMGWIGSLAMALTLGGLGLFLVLAVFVPPEKLWPSADEGGDFLRRLWEHVASITRWFWWW